MPHTDLLAQAAALLHNADGVLITAGAGMGVDSGLPDFRGNTGLWQHYPALGQQRLDFTAIANPQAFRTQPRLAWGFYGHRLQLYRQTRPHAGFALLQELAAALPHGAFVFTSNVDGQFQQAGFANTQIHECHGSIHWLQCTQSCTAAVWPNELPVTVDAARCQWLGELPQCPSCGALARPNILMFGDWSWQARLYDSQAQQLRAWLARVQRPVVLEVGAGTAIPTVRLLSEEFAPRLIRINPRESQVPRGQGVSLAMGGLQGIQAVLERWRTLR